MSNRIACMGLVAALAGLAACADKEPKTVAPTQAVEGHYDAEAIRTEVTALADELDIDREQRDELMGRLAVMLRDPEFAAEMRRKQVQGVGVYHRREGGLLVKVGRGDGRIRFAGDAREYPFVLSSSSAGALVGGSASSGVVLALGLADTTDIEGKYSGKVRSTTAMDASKGALHVEHMDGDAELWFVGVAEGLSANAGIEEVKLAFGTPED